ncbi:hypothetical protein BSKO_01128 [Bryopsis sp. KO-2023]|nr:hypothetical protein BSKO_01128 [Bryopsis sp. KO-2023]
MASMRLPAHDEIESGEQRDAKEGERVVAGRAGSVLIQNTILKADHFPGCQNKKLIPNIDGAPNFRQVEDLPVYGVAVPTVVGLRIVLDIVGADRGQRKVLWHNMREEPLIYVNGKPYVVREADQPFANLEYTGIDRTRVEEMENRLKEDVLREAELYNGRILLAGENDDYEVVEFWADVTESSIQTPQEVIAQMIDAGYDVDYLRVPVTDEKAPKEVDCEQLIERCWNPPEGAALMFNCQMGRGRTTTGMIIASLLQLWRMGALSGNGPIPGASLPRWFRPCTPDAQNGSSNSTILKSGMYGVVRSLLRMLSRGKEGKHVLDSVIDACSAMQNLREAIVTYRDRMSAEHNERKRNSLLRICLEYLERYCVLIAFTSYLAHPRFDPSSPNFIGFLDYMKMRPEFKSVLQRLLRRNPMSALELHKRTEMASSGNTRSPGSNSSVDEDDDDKDPTSRLIAQRSGKVLLQYTILKEDHFPGIHKSGVPQIISGAPNFRQAPGLAVYGSALPTMDGIKKVLKYVDAEPTSSKQLTAVWHNMREEPVVYINGRPFVLREEARPFKNLREYSGIDGRRLQQMETRLKMDILEEAKMYDGRILVGREAPSSGNIGCLEDQWESIGGQEDVQTPAEVYAALQQQGYKVNYFRLPVTDGTSPHFRDIDTLMANIRDANPDSPLIFNCHNGAGRSTTGMVIGSLFRLKELRSSLSETVLTYSLSLDGSSPPGCISPSTSDDSDDGEDPEAAALGLDQDVDVMDPCERIACEEGRYLAVRRLIRLLDSGPDSKQAVDRIIDACGMIINLRTAIMRYRKPLRGHNRPETQNRHTLFKWGVAYLERYCLTIAFSAYLDHTQSGATASFHDWVNERAEVRLALRSIKNNPGASLSVLSDTMSTVTQGVVDGPQVDISEEEKVQSQRHGSVLSKKTILKSFHMAEYIPRSNSSSHVPHALPEMRRTEGMPVYTVGNLSVDALRRLLSHFDAGPSGQTHVVISDIREEMVVYVRGTPHIRRDFERPVSSLKHPGVAAEQLEQLEESLRDDAQAESREWGGRILLHREVLTHSTDQRAHKDDVTLASEDPVASVVGFWRRTGGTCDLDDGVCTPQDVQRGLAKEGFKVSYARIPLSRERITQAKDMDQLRQWLGVGFGGDRVVYLIMSRTATGSSTRFVSSFIACYLSWSAPNLHSMSFDQTASMKPVYKTSKLALGEFRAIMNLCRVLPKGIEDKRAVDEAIDRCHRIGSLREDILSCKYSVDGSAEQTSKANKLGLHYIRRYFFLIAFRSYLDNRSSTQESFTSWVQNRQELLHLLSTISLQK